MLGDVLQNVVGGPLDVGGGAFLHQQGGNDGDDDEVERVVHVLQRGDKGVQAGHRLEDDTHELGASLLSGFPKPGHV